MRTNWIQTVVTQSVYGVLFTWLNLAVVPTAHADYVAVEATSPTFTTLETTIFSVSCNQCHSGSKPAGTLDLTTYAGIIRAKVVIAGNAVASPLYKAVSKDLMPPKGAPLNSDQITAIADWIDAGALNN